MGPLANLIMMYMRDYSDEWVGKDYPPPMTVQAYARARLMNDFDGALHDVMMYIETNGGIG